VGRRGSTSRDDPRSALPHNILPISRIAVERLVVVVSRPPALSATQDRHDALARRRETRLKIIESWNKINNSFMINDVAAVFFGRA
jgi:hypothetical protein